ncbi:MAG: helix-turn-helix domain-containing protein [Actinomycetales bacterium]
MSEAAAELRLSVQRVRQLIRSGSLPARRVSGRWVLDDADVSRLAAQNRPAHVRAFARPVAWGAAALSDGVVPEWLSTTQVSRLRRRLDDAGNDVGAWRARMRARSLARHALRVGRLQLPSLLLDDLTRTTGASSSNLVTDPLSDDGSATVWAAEDAAVDTLISRFGLLPSSTGNLVVLIAGLPSAEDLGQDGRNAYRLVVAVDLLDGTSAREHDAGEALLAAVLAETRWRDR